MLKSLYAAVVVVVAAAAPAARAEALALDVGLLTGAAGTVIDTALTSSTPELAMVPMLPVLDLAMAQTTGGGASAPPQLSGVGLGIQVGFPTSITLKIGAAQANGLVFGLGAGFGYYNRFQPYLSIHGEYQLHLFTLVRNASLAMTGYFAPGLWIALAGDGQYGFYNGARYGPFFGVGLGVRGTFGLSMLFTQAPVEIYLEATPAIFVFPGFDPTFGWSLGFRYYF